jgi:hypothetical protein
MDENGNKEIFEQGNGIQHVRFSNDLLRVSKAIEAGGQVNYGYGWIDMTTTEGIVV